MVTQHLPKSVALIIRIKVHPIITWRITSGIISFHHDAGSIAHPIGRCGGFRFRQIKPGRKDILILLRNRKDGAIHIPVAAFGHTWKGYSAHTCFIRNNLQIIISPIRFHSRQCKIGHFCSRHIHTGNGTQHFYS